MRQAQLSSFWVCDVRTNETNTEREATVPAACPVVYKTLAADLSRQLIHIPNPYTVTISTPKPSVDKINMVETTSGLSVALRLVLPFGEDQENSREPDPIAIFLPRVTNLAAWFSAFLTDIHEIDPERVPQKPPRLSQPKDWYTPEERALEVQISVVTHEIDRLSEERIQLQNELTTKKLSQNGKSPLATEPQECARKLQQSDVVRRLFVVAYQNSTALGEPCYGPFHNPPARRIPLAPRTVQLLLADASDVWPIAVSGDGSTTRRIVIPLVQAQVLWVILGELRTFDHNRLQGLIQQRGVVGVGSGNHNAQWAALSFHKQAPLAASLAAIRWVGSNQIPPKRALPMAPSAACHSQSTPPNSSHCSTKALHIRRKTPSSTHR